MTTIKSLLLAASVAAAGSATTVVARDTEETPITNLVRIASADPRDFERDYRGLGLRARGRLLDTAPVLGTDRVAHVIEIGNVLVVCVVSDGGAQATAPPAATVVSVTGALDMSVEGVLYLGRDCVVARPGG